ncbi:hypothetical protein BKA67DRAFT_657117 [Truncatella angustata]|uniref:Uncharacterized protein n=1 Tax=Truncatella angustata TaxID=152316 RepID=A0A9P8ZYM0_9PEZI|nr:uncharacterized protein BKA67DRAFT_657117 [Truncatella angustata]KAH6655163.1 hypothetical protein BKA67DRAFT_657117 [Truncatella angustata]KAH8200447.1 hypothetical protein TruAng_005410 [Truncatella angustata]
MAKPKQLLKQAAKPKQKKEQTFNTADDYLAAGVEHEEAAGKWRAGDAAKSMRFFQRAIEAYDQGLKAFPSSLDLAYNKARVLVEVATHPILVAQLKAPLLDALKFALDAHQYALKLDPENADALFNTAQVLTSIAEEIANNDDIPDKEALKLLQEALELQSKCYSIQELKLEESMEQERQANEQAAELEDETETTATDEQQPDQGSNDEDDQWFAVVEPVTRDSLIDTLVAQFNTLTTLCSILTDAPEIAPPATLPMIEEYSSNLVQRIPGISQDKPERLQEISLSKANFISVLLEAGFKSGKIDATTYKRERDTAFTVPELSTNGTAETLLANARSLISFNSALADAYSSESAVRWNALTEAVQQLTAAAKVQGTDQSELATTHLLRGDANLFLYALALPPASHQAAITNAGQLTKNSEVFYRNASKLSGTREEKATASLRSVVAQHLQQQISQGTALDIGAIVSASSNGPQWALEQLEDMMAEGLLPQSLAI